MTLDTDSALTNVLNVPLRPSLLVELPFVLLAPLVSSQLPRPPLAQLVLMDVPPVLMLTLARPV